MGSIRTGFRYSLLAAVGLVIATILSYTFSHSRLEIDSTRSKTLDRIADEGMELVQLTNAILQYSGPRSLGQWHGQHREFLQLLDTLDAPADGEEAELAQRLRQRLAVMGIWRTSSPLRACAWPPAPRRRKSPRSSAPSCSRRPRSCRPSCAVSAPSPTPP